MPDTISIKFIKTCFVAQYKIYIGECSLCMWEQCVFCCCWNGVSQSAKYHWSLVLPYWLSCPILKVHNWSPLLLYCCLLFCSCLFIVAYIFGYFYVGYITILKITSFCQINSILFYSGKVGYIDLKNCKRLLRII